MAKSMMIAIVLVAGYVVALPVLLWGLKDIARIPGGVWRHLAQRPRHQWRIGMISAYSLGGWPCIVAVVAWRRGRERSDLLYEWADLSARKRNGGRHSAPRPAPEPVIVLADYEDPSAHQVGLSDT